MSTINNKEVRFTVFILLLINVFGCGPQPYTLGDIKTFDPDTTAIPEPGVAREFEFWDDFDNAIFHQLEKPLDLNRVAHFLGRSIGVANPVEADNVNVLDEVPESSWFTHRHYYNKMTFEELKQGPNKRGAPDTENEWVIFSSKLRGATSGFFIEDAKGMRYLIKFDAPDFPELSTSAQMIGTLIFHAAGYTVPEAYITHFDPKKVTIQEGVMVGTGKNRRPMTQSDLDEILRGRLTNDEGKIRAFASTFVDGTPVGPWRLEGVRKDDPNDKVRHEDRRELRGMRVLSSWLNDTDRRDANTFAVYNGKYIDHYVQDFGNVIGANGSGMHTPLHGQAYLIDPRYMALNLITFGTRVSTWETVDPGPIYPGIGYFRADVFKPGSWAPVHPIPAFENMTLRDAFWGAKLVTQFTDEEIKAIVETGQLSNPDAEAYLIDVLIKRRDKIGRYWFSRVNPVDKFVFTRNSNGNIAFSFTDIAVKDGIFKQSDTTYRLGLFNHKNKQIGPWIGTKSTHTTLQRFTSSDSFKHFDNPEKNVYKFRILTQRPEQKKKKQPVDVYFYYTGSPESLRIIGIDRKYE